MPLLRYNETITLRRPKTTSDRSGSRVKDYVDVATVQAEARDIGGTTDRIEEQTEIATNVTLFRISYRPDVRTDWRFRAAKRGGEWDIQRIRHLTLSGNGRPDTHLEIQAVVRD